MTIKLRVYGSKTKLNIQVTDTHICSFKSNFKKYCKKSVKSTCKIAILQAIRSLESDIDIVQLDDDHLIDWAILEYSKNNNVSTCQCKANR